MYHPDALMSGFQSIKIKIGEIDVHISPDVIVYIYPSLAPTSIISYNMSLFYNIICTSIEPILYLL